MMYLLLNNPNTIIPTAALECISSHGDKFSAQLYDHYDTLFPWLIQWCSSKNRDDYKAAIPALDTFITVLSNILELQSPEDKKTVQIFKVWKKFL